MTQQHLASTNLVQLLAIDHGRNSSECKNQKGDDREKHGYKHLGLAETFTRQKLPEACMPKIGPPVVFFAFIGFDERLPFHLVKNELEKFVAASKECDLAIGRFVRVVDIAKRSP